MRRCVQTRSSATNCSKTRVSRRSHRKAFPENDCEAPGILDKLLAVLNRPKCRLVASQALCSITHHGGIGVRTEIAKKSNVLIKILEEQTDSPKLTQLLVATLSHSVLAVVCEEEPDRKIMKLMDVQGLVRALVQQLRKPDVSSGIRDHAISFLCGAAQNCSEAFFNYPTAINLFVACARSKSFQLRAMAALGVMKLHFTENEEEDIVLDPKKLLVAFQRRMPDHLTNAVRSRGTLGEMFLTLKAIHDHQKAMLRVLEDNDLYQLGRTIAELILVTEFSIPSGAFEMVDSRTGKRVNDSTGLPFQQWDDALPYCAEAIRKKGVKGEEDMADIIELKYLVKMRRMDEAHILAKKAIERNPRVGFYYYVLSIGATEAIGLRWAKKGLKCPKLTNYVRYALLYRAAEHAAILGFRVLCEAQESDAKFDEGVAFIMSALEDSKTFIDNAPPDTRNMKSVIYVYTLAYFVAKGHELTPDLNDLSVS